MGVFAARSLLLAALLLCCSLPALAALLAHQKFCVLFRISNRDTKHTHTHTKTLLLLLLAYIQGWQAEGGREGKMHLHLRFAVIFGCVGCTN